MRDGMGGSAERLIAAMFQAGTQSRDPPQVYVGTVLDGSEEGLKIRCNGQELEREDLWIPPRLLKGWSPKLAGTLSGTCSSHGGSVTVLVSADQLTRSEFGLKTGDTVLLFTPDQQEYFIVDKVVKLE